MKKTVVISDLQLHNHMRWSHVTEGGFNSRLLDGIHALDQAVELADGGTVIVSGDFFHDSRSISIDVLFQAARWVNRAATACQRVIISVGNHDTYLKSGTIHSLECFRRPNVEVVDSHQKFSGFSPLATVNERYPFFIAAYTEDLEKLRDAMAALDDNTICILHQDVKGGVMNGGRVSESGLTIKELERFKLVLLGHFHEHQKLADNVFYVGSPYQIDKGEMGQPKYMAVIEDGEVSWVPTEGAPEYHVVDYETFRAFRKTGSYTNHFWEVVCNAAQREALLETPPVGANYEVIAERVEAVVEAGVQDAGSLTVQDAVRGELERLGSPELVEEALSRLD
jgi:DNA repair exonuclease SbcCD nuclease subunit